MNSVYVCVCVYAHIYMHVWALAQSLVQTRQHSIPELHPQHSEYYCNSKTEYKD